MFKNGMILGTLSVIGFYILFRKLPGGVRRFIIRKTFTTDVAAMIITYLVFNGGVTALLAAAVACVEVSILLMIANDPDMLSVVNKWIGEAGGIKEKMISYFKSPEGNSPVKVGKQVFGWLWRRA